PEHHYPGACEAPLELIERGHLLHARRTPGGPEVQHQQLPAEVRRRDGAAVVGGDREVRRGVTDGDELFVERIEDDIDEHGQQQDNEGVDRAFELKGRHTILVVYIL